MENTLVPNRKFQEQFRNRLASIYLEFESKLTAKAKQNLSELRHKVESRNISFSNRLFGRLSILEVLANIANDVVEELIKEDILDHKNLIKESLFIEVKTDEKGKSSVRSYDIELFIARIRYLCILIDNSIYFRHFEKFKGNLSFVAELYAGVIATTTTSSKICACCFRDIASINKKDSKNTRSRKYCHVHKCKDSEETETQILAVRAFDKLSTKRKEYHMLLSHIKINSEDYLQLLPNTQENRINELVKSASYHGLSFGNAPTLIQDHEFIIKNNILPKVPETLEGVITALKAVKPISSKLFVRPKYFEYIEMIESADWQSSQQKIKEELASTYPRTFKSFKASVPNTPSLKEFIQVLQVRDFLDNEHNSCTHFHYLVAALNLSEDLLIEIENLKANERRQRENSVNKEKTRKQIIVDLHQQGANVSEIKRHLDGLGNNTARKTISKIIDNFKEVENVAPM